MAINPVIFRHSDPNRINGLLIEDRLRTALMFALGNCAAHPTHPIDISAAADLIQGLPTHVKLKQKKYDKNGNLIPYSFAVDYSIDMACAYAFWLLFGDHRFLIAFYEMEKHYDENGVEFKVIRCDELVEIIITESTLKAFRGNVSRQEMGRLKGNILAWDPKPKNAYEAKLETQKACDRFHPIAKDMRERPGAGIARPKVHINLNKKGTAADNKRIQSTISTAQTINHVMNEDIGYGLGKYRNAKMPGSQVQDRCILYNNTKPFYGISFPWRTRASVKNPAKGWSRLKRIGRITPKIAKPLQKIPTGKNAKYILDWKRPALVDIPFGQLAITRHDDEMRTIYLDAQSDEVRENIAWAFRSVPAEFIEEADCWLASYESTKKVVEAFKARPLPEAPHQSLLEEIEGKPGLYRITTKNGPYLTKQFKRGDWAIWHGARSRQAQKKVLERRMSSAFFVAGLAGGEDPILESKLYHENVNWIVPGEDPEMIERVARALVDYTYLEWNRPSCKSDRT